ncbi:MAG: lipoprotein-releasing ABC transporter permease subunit [Desulfobacteraceae bacterium]|nr:lipoprotein-releasing ABC transporter permease subunit [Desulfobacteraceae bacterium]MBC2755316.1 lipoprotein-releasing ABC transporter permease subunit [Desulfobacteraceae bacterium]
MSFEYFVGGRYLRSRHKHAFISFITFLSMAGVTVGVMALIIVIAVMSGAESYFTSQILGVESHIIIRRHGGTIADYEGVIHQVESEAGVQSAAPFVYSQVMLRSSSGISGAVLRGIDPYADGSPIKGYDKESLIEKIRPQVTADSGILSPGIILGKELALTIGAAAGETIYLISPKGMMSPIGHMPTMKRFEVTGIFESGFYEYDASLAFIHLKTAQKLIKIGDSVSGIGVRVDDIYRANEISQMILADLGFPYWTVDWMQMNRNFFSALKLEKKAMFVILTLIIMVAAFNIASTLIMMVMGKTQDIAILKAMGATDRSIWKIFVFKGTVIGLIGTVSGVVLGILGCVVLKYYKFIELPGDVYYFTSLPVQLEFLDVFLIVSAALAICFISTLYPAYKASKLNPVEALRYG